MWLSVSITPLNPALKKAIAKGLEAVESEDGISEEMQQSPLIYSTAESKLQTKQKGWRTNSIFCSKNSEFIH